MKKGGGKKGEGERGRGRGKGEGEGRGRGKGKGRGKGNGKRAPAIRARVFLFRPPINCEYVASMVQTLLLCLQEIVKSRRFFQMKS